MTEPPRTVVLYVGGDPTVATGLEDADGRFAVECVPDADAALERLAAGDIDCVLAESDRSGRDGIELLEAVRTARPETPFVLLTGDEAGERAAEALKAGDVASETVVQRCRDVGEVVDRMELLIEGLLTMAEQGQRVLEFEAVDLEAVAEAAWEQVRSSEADLRVGTTTIEADPDRLRELLSNLFRNAIEHTGPDMTVRVGPLDFVPGFFVVDDGPGIPPEERERVPDRGFTTHEEGTGFGLAVVEQIADAHGWLVAVTEGTEGGARFEFSAEGH